MQRDADQDDDAMSRTVDDATTDDVNMETASSPTPGKRDGGDAVGNPHVKKRQRTSQATLENDAPPPPPAARDKSNFLSTDTQKAKVKKRGFSIAHEFEREINVAQPPTSLQQSQSPDRRSVSPVPPPLAHRGGNDVDFFPPAPSLFSSPKPPTPETGAARKPKRSTATATHRRDTISPGRAVPMPQSELPGDNSSSRRDTLSPDGFRRIESLVEDEESSQERAGHKELEEEEKTEEGKDSSHRLDDSPSHAATPHPIETRRLPTSPQANDKDDDVVAHTSPPHATTVASVRGAAAAAEKSDMAARRSTLDPTELAGMFGSSDLATSHDMAASGRRDTLDPLEALAVLEGISTLEGGEHEGQQHKKKKLAQELALDSHATIGPTNQYGTSNEDNASKRDTLNPSDLMQLDSDDDDDHLVLSSFQSERSDGQVTSTSSPPSILEAIGKPTSPPRTKNDTISADPSRDRRRRRSTRSPTPSSSSLGPSTRQNSTHETKRVVTKPGPHPSLFSPPNRHNHPTPLKSCLSARKTQPPPSSSPTPTKSVVFGSPRGAEFRRNDPPTSMTPMCVLQTREMFPLDKIDSDDDDDVTSENTSILDEADHLLDKEEENHSLSFPFGSIRSPTRKRNQAAPNNVVGVSPLDNIADARRKRRASFGARQQQSASLVTQQQQQPSRRQSLLGVNVMQNNDALVIVGSAKKPRPATSTVVDSSSDDDMDITGDFTAQNHPSSVQLSNGLGDLWNETNYTPPKVNNAHSSDEDDDQTLELGPIGHLQGDASVFNTTKTLSQDTTVSHFQGLLHPIAEGEEATSTRSSLLSHLSLSSDEDDDDAKYVAQRESVVINLGEKFDKLGGSSGKKNKLKHDPMSLSPRHLEDQPRPTVSTTTSVSLENTSRTPVPTPNPPQGDKSTAFIPSDSSSHDISSDPSAQVVALAPSSPPHQPTTDQLSTKVAPLDFDTPAAQQDAPRLTTATFAELVAALTLTSVDDAIERQVAECADLLVVSAVLPQTTTRWSQAVDQLSTWVAEMAVERRLNEAKLVPSYLAALLQTTNEFPHDLVVELYHANVSSVLSEWFAWRRRLEAASMAVWNGGAGLQAEYQGLQQRLASVGRDEAQERAAVHQLMAKARSMDRSLASIQEQQMIRAEVSARLHRLDKQLSQLQSTLAKHTQDAALHRIETTDAVVSDTHMHDRIHAVQAHDELFQIASKLAKWTYTSMSPTQWELRMMLTSLHSDMSIIVSLDVDVSKATCQVQVVLPPRKHNKQHSVFDDVAALVCAALLDPVRLQQASDATVRQVSDVPAFVQWVQLDVQRSVRLWRDMETLVLQHAITTDVASKQLWIAFVSFQSLVKVRVGLPLSTHFCFRRWTAPPVVVVEFGKAKVDVVELVRRIEGVPRGFRRLHAICTCVTTYIESLE